ncbi:uncharacterized protein LOC144666866 isoform X1 [Oculina patagonica]
MSVPEMSASPSDSNGNSLKQSSLLLSIYGYAPYPTPNPPSTKLKKRALGRSSSLGIIENIKRRSLQPLPLTEETYDASKRNSCIEIRNYEMPKRTASSDRERKTSSRLFRSMSLSGRKQSNKEQTASDDKRNSTISISDPEKVTILMDHNAQLLDEKNKAVDQCDKMNKDLQDATNKLKEAEREIQNLKELLSTRITQEFDNCETDANEKRTRISFSELELEAVESKDNNVIFPSKVEHLETTIEANAVPLQKSTTSCKECERLKESRIKAFVEAIALRKYVKNLNDALSGGEASKQNFLNDVQKKLVAAQTEKEIALEELATVIDQRNQAVREKDKALEEWGKATSKWETTLDQLDSLVKELNKVKSERDDLTKKLKRKEDALEKIKQETSSLLSEQIEVTKQEQNDSAIDQDIILRDRFGNTDSVRKLSTELTKSQQRNIEMDARVTSLEEKSETYKRERDHAKEQWRQSVKERKRLHREIASIVQARDEAIQKCFSTAEQLEKLKEEYNHLLNRLAKTGLSANNSSELSIPCSLKECKFCAGDSTEGLETPDTSFTESEEIRVTLEKDDPLDSIKMARVSMSGRPFTAIIDIDKAFGSSRNIRKYDEIVSINDIPVTESDQNLVKSLLDGAITALTMVLKRPVGSYQISFDLDLKAPKKSKAGLGFECGLYVKNLKHGLLSEDQNNLKIGDYIMKMNGKHLDKIIASSVEKVTKKSGDKLKLHVTRTIVAMPKNCEFKPLSTTDSESDTVVLRRLPRCNGDNRLSLISNDSSMSRDSRFSCNSSMGSMSSNNDSSLADSNSDLYGNKYSGYGYFMSDRHRTATAVYSPSSDSQLETIVADDWPDVRTGDGSQNASDAKEGDSFEPGTLKPNSRSPMNRKFVSTSQLQSGTFLTPSSVDGTLVRAQSTITAVRVDDDGLNSGLIRSSTTGTIIPMGTSPRVMRLEKKPLDGLGLEVSGGYRVGIYVTELQDNSVCKAAGLQVGDRLLKLNSYDLTRATLDHATRIVRLLSTCTYLRIEAQLVSNYKEILEDQPYDSLYVRTIHPYKAMAPDELSFTVGETLHVINTRANYDQAKQSWKWVAQRARKDGKVLEEGLVPCMGSIPAHVESAVLSQNLQRFESESEEQMSDDAPSTLKRASTERRSIIQRYRKLMRRESRDFPNNMDENGNSNKVTFYEILSKISD